MKGLVTRALEHLDRVLNQADAIPETQGSRLEPPVPPWRSDVFSALRDALEFVPSPDEVRALTGAQAEWIRCHDVILNNTADKVGRAWIAQGSAMRHAILKGESAPVFKTRKELEAQFEGIVEGATAAQNLIVDALRDMAADVVTRFLEQADRFINHELSGGPGAPAEFRATGPLKDCGFHLRRLKERIVREGIGGGGSNFSPQHLLHVFGDPCWVIPENGKGKR